MTNTYKSGDDEIRKIPGGYIIGYRPGPALRRLLIDDDGAILNASGDRLEVRDLEKARSLLPHVGGQRLVPLLRESKLTPQMVRMLRRWVRPQ